MQLNYEDLNEALSVKKSITKFGSLICVEKQIPDSDGAGELDPRVVQLINESASKITNGTTSFPDLSAISPDHFPIEAFHAAMRQWFVNLSRARRLSLETACSFYG